MTDPGSKHFKFPDELWARVMHFADTNKLSRAAAVRRLLTERLDELEKKSRR